MDKNKKRKSYLIPLLVLLIGISLGGIYSYWVGQVGNPNNYTDQETVVIGAGQSIETELDVTKELANAGKKLVPEGKASVSVGGTEQNVESFEATYTVKWEESGTADVIDSSDAITGTLNVAATSEIEGANEQSGLVNVTVEPTSQEITADGNEVTVRVRVTLTEPANKAAYDAIVGKNIKVNLTFSVEQ